MVLRCPMTLQELRWFLRESNLTQTFEPRDGNDQPLEEQPWLPGSRQGMGVHAAWPQPFLGRDLQGSDAALAVSFPGGWGDTCRRIISSGAWLSQPFLQSQVAV